MFSDVFNTYDFKDATFEILIMLIVAFVLGMLFYKFFFCGSCKKSVSSSPDDLTVVEGVGNKIQSLLNEAGIYSYEQLANANVSSLKEVLENAGSRFTMHDPTTWPKQAGMAAKGDLDALKKYQDKLDGGRA